MVSGLCQGHFDSVVKTDDEGRMVFTDQIARIGSMPSDYSYTEAEAMAEDWSAEGTTGPRTGMHHLPGVHGQRVPLRVPRLSRSENHDDTRNRAHGQDEAPLRRR